MKSGLHGGGVQVQRPVPKKTEYVIINFTYLYTLHIN